MVRARYKQLYLILLGQVLCVGVGLWMQHNLLRPATREAIASSMWSDMESAGAHLLRACQRNTRESGFAEACEAARAESILQRTPLPGLCAAVVDADWHPLMQWPNVDLEGPAGTSPDLPLLWRPLSDEPGGTEAPIRGTLKGREGEQVGVAYRFADGSGYLLLHRPQRDAGLAAASSSGTLLALAGVTSLWMIALLSITTYLIWTRHRETLDRALAQSESNNLRQAQSLIRTRDSVIFALARLANFRDDETGSHLERISIYSALLASAARSHPKFAGRVSPKFVRTIKLSAVLHDIGKVAIEDSVLRKPGSLSPRERKRMQEHTVLAGNCLREIVQHLGSSNFLDMAHDIAVAHHERWDGSGYPYGLQGDAIPLSARIVAIADVYDALATRRIYKGAVAHERCVTMIRNAAGKQFDPDLVEVWLTVESKFKEIAVQCAGIRAAGGNDRDCAAPQQSALTTADADSLGGLADEDLDDAEFAIESSASL